MTVPHKVPLGIKEPKTQKNPYGLSASGNSQMFQDVRTYSQTPVQPPYYNDFGNFCVGSSGAVNAVNKPKN